VRGLTLFLPPSGAFAEFQISPRFFNNCNFKNNTKKFR
jgi:hypothetical protein